MSATTHPLLWKWRTSLDKSNTGEKIALRYDAIFHRRGKNAWSCLLSYLSTFVCCIVVHDGCVCTYGFVCVFVYACLGYTSAHLQSSNPVLTVTPQQLMSITQAPLVNEACPGVHACLCVSAAVLCCLATWSQYFSTLVWAAVGATCTHVLAHAVMLDTHKPTKLKRISVHLAYVWTRSCIRLE